jgi:hypothetical protein
VNPSTKKLVHVLLMNIYYKIIINELKATRICRVSEPYPFQICRGCLCAGISCKKKEFENDVSNVQLLSREKKKLLQLNKLL